MRVRFAYKIMMGDRSKSAREGACIASSTRSLRSFTSTDAARLQH